MRLGRDAFYDVLDLDVEHSLRLLQAGLTIVTGTEDAAEGIRLPREAPAQVERPVDGV